MDMLVFVGTTRWRAPGLKLQRGHARGMQHLKMYPSWLYVGCIRVTTPVPNHITHPTSHCSTSHHITANHITLHHTTAHHITSHHITSHCITSHHITAMQGNSRCTFYADVVCNSDESCSTILFCAWSFYSLSVLFFQEKLEHLELENVRCL